MRQHPFTGQNIQQSPIVRRSLHKLPNTVLTSVVLIFVLGLHQLKGNEGAVNYYRLCLRLICQQSLQFFKENIDWIQNADETFGGKKDLWGDSFLPEDYRQGKYIESHGVQNIPPPPIPSC